MLLREDWSERGREERGAYWWGNNSAWMMQTDWLTQCVTWLSHVTWGSAGAEGPRDDLVSRWTHETGRLVSSACHGRIQGMFTRTLIASQLNLTRSNTFVHKWNDSCLSMSLTAFTVNYRLLSWMELHGRNTSYSWVELMWCEQALSQLARPSRTPS